MLTRSQFIHKAQIPLPNLLVVGEVVAENQGWTEGALESVEKVVTKKWIQ
jgi:monoamine oxidase